MGRVVKVLLTAVALGASVWLVRDHLIPLLRSDRAPSPPPSPISADPSLPPGLEERVFAASDGEAAAIFRDEIDRSRNGGALLRLFERRAERAASTLEREIEAHVHAFRYRRAAEVGEEYRRAWRGSRAEAAITSLLDDVRAMESDLILRRRAEADALLEEGRLDAAREALVTTWELEPEYRAKLDQHAREVEERIARVTLSPPPPPSAEPMPTLGADPKGPPSPPTLPGGPHPDIRRLSEARVLLRRARSMMDSGRHDPASRALTELVETYGDLTYVRRRREGLAALRALADYGKRGVVALFHAGEARRTGKRVELRYMFEREDEAWDWETLKTVPHKLDGVFETTRGGVRGTGAMSYLHRGFFRNDVTIRARATAGEPRTHGLAFCQAGDETRQIMLLVTNHWFVEGENYVKERPGHSLIMIGKGTNNDVPVDSPETGFIFRVTRDRPEVPRGTEAEIQFRLEGTHMEGVVACGGKDATLRGEATGDDGRAIERLRPALIVVDASARFREVVIEGELHPAFERERIDDLHRVVERMED